MANIRTIDYKGFNYATGSGPSGFALWSGSWALSESAANSTSYQGIGAEFISDGNNFLRFRTNPSEFVVKAEQFFLGGTNQFVSGAGGNIEISSSNFHLNNSGDVIMQGTITADAGNIGGFSINGAAIASTNGNLILSGSGLITASAGLIGGFVLASDSIKSTNDNLILRSNGQITGSLVLFDGGTIGGFTITSNKINSSTDLILSSSGEITGSKVLFDGGTIGGFALTTDKISSGTDLILSSSGEITGSKVLFTGGKIAGFDISGNTLTATDFTLDASGKRLTLGAGTNIFIADGDEGIQLGHGTFASAPFSVTKAGVLKAESGTVAGWTIDTQKFTGGKMIINKDGTVQTSDYASNQQGFILSAASGGFLEVENAKIRGTLATAVFEKESVSAIGGQLYVANSTTLTSSLISGQEASDNQGGTYKATDTTMSVVNVTGFEVGEILSAKKFNSTGFATEYILVQSASRANPSSDTDFSGFLFVQRGYGSGVSGNSGSLGDTPGSAQDYSGSQVLVSTGKLGTGFIRLNANPNDQTTPYIDIVERTGSGIYDTELKARIGDLSGVANSGPVNTSTPGFGLYSENVFLEGGIVANTGSIGGIEMENGKLYNGTGTHGNSNTGFYVDSSSKFSLGDKLVWDGSNLSVQGSITISNPSAQPFPTSASVASTTSASDASITDTSSSLSTTIVNTSSSVATTTSASNASITDASSSLSTTIVNTSSSVATTTSASDASITDASSSLSTTIVSTSSSVATTTSASNASITDASSSLSTTIVNTSSSVATTTSASDASITDASASLSTTIVNTSSSIATTTSASDASITDASASLASSISASNASTSSLENPSTYTFGGNGFTLGTSHTPTTGLNQTSEFFGYFEGTTPKTFMSSSGDFFLGGTGGSFIFDESAGSLLVSGSNVTLHTPQFFLGNRSTQFISGAAGGVEISSSNFHLNASGSITASAGSIGAWEISDSNLKDTTGTIEINASESYIRLAPSYPTGIVPAFNLQVHTRADGGSPPTSKYNNTILELNDSNDTCFEEVIDPFGHKTIGIMSYPDSGHGAEGGYKATINNNISAHKIENYDPGQKYMFVQYFKFHESHTGSFYQGWRGLEGGTIKPMIRPFQNTTEVTIDFSKTTYKDRYEAYLGAFSGNTEPATTATAFMNVSSSNLYSLYARRDNWPSTDIELERWYAGITYLLPMTASYFTSSLHRYFQEVKQSGLYDMETGRKIAHGVAPVSRGNFDGIKIRAFEFYNSQGDGNTKYVTMLHPSLFKMDGTEPSVNEMVFGSSTILDSEGTVSSSNVELSGRVSTRNLKTKVIRIDGRNYTNYLREETFSSNTDSNALMHHLVLDGSLGGVETNHVIIDLDCSSYNNHLGPDTAYPYINAIGKITPPRAGNDESIEFTIEIENGRTVKFFDVDEYNATQADTSIFSNGDGQGGANFAGAISNLGTGQPSNVTKNAQNDK